MFLKKKACSSAHGQVSSQRCYCVHGYVCAHVRIEIWVLSKIYVPEKENWYFCIWTTFLPGMLLCTYVRCAHVRVEIWVLTEIHVPGKESLYFCVWTSFLSAKLLCTHAWLCTCAWRNLSACQNSCSWKRKLVHLDYFPLSDVTVYMHMLVHMCTQKFGCLPKFMFLKRKACPSA